MSLQLKELRDGVWSLDMGSTENRMTPHSLSTLLDAVTKLAAGDGTCKGLILGASGKYWCNGVDLKLVAAKGVAVGQQIMDLLLQVVDALLCAPFWTVAAVQGHAFGGGLVLALCCDFRVMVHRRGWICMPALDLGIRLPYPLLNVILKKISSKHLQAVLLSGQRFGGAEAQLVGLVDQVVPDGSQLVAKCVSMIPRPVDGRTLAYMKRSMYYGAQQSASIFPSTSQLKAKL